MSSDETGDPVRRRRAIERPYIVPGPLADLKALLYELYVRAGMPALDEIAGWIARDQDVTGCPGRDTVTRIIGGTGMPASQADVTTVATVLARAARWDPADAARRARDMWVAARMAPVHASPCWVRVSEADPRVLGVHAAISVPGVPDDVPPRYVPRECDEGEPGVRARVAAAARHGGFVLLVGDSSAGKTRSAFEAVRALLPGWLLAHPAGPEEVAALAPGTMPEAVVWLDELQNYLDGDRGRTTAAIRKLLSLPRPVVILATLWSDRYNAWVSPPPVGHADPHAWERQILKLADIVHVASLFTKAEQDQARLAAADDPRLQVALGTAGFGLTQTLAAGPQLVARWENADPYARAVLDAALDAARLGAHHPLPASFLQAAAPGYCTSQQQAEAPDDWFEAALAYATRKLLGATSALVPAGAGMGQLAGYAPADYLTQHAGKQRSNVCLPAATWDAMLTCLTDPADALRLAHSAESRMLYAYAIPLYERAASSGDEYAARRLASLLAQRGDLNQLRSRAAAGDSEASWCLADFLAGCGDLEELRAQAGAGSPQATWHLASLLVEQGDPAGAIRALRPPADAGDMRAATKLAHLLAEHGDPGEAVQVLQRLAEVGYSDSAHQLTDLLAEQGDIEQLRTRADAGDEMACASLAHLLAERGELDELTGRAEAGDKAAAFTLACRQARRGDWQDAVEIVDRMAEPDARRLLAEVLEDHGNQEAAAQILRQDADSGNHDAAQSLAYLLARRGDEAELRDRATAGDGPAARELATLLARKGDLGELQVRADAGDDHAAVWLAALLAERGDMSRLRARADAGNAMAAHQLADLLALSGDRGQLEERAAAGDEFAALALIEVLVELSEIDLAIEVLERHIAEPHTPSLRADLLAKRGDIRQLQAQVMAGNYYAAEHLPRALIADGRDDDAARLRRLGLRPDGSLASE